MLLTALQRPPRDGEWNRGKAILFIVTLAATGTVTLAAREAGMSRKAAYALRKRDPLFAAYWEAATKAADRRAKSSRQGDKSVAAVSSTSSSATPAHRAGAARPADPPAWRRRLFAELQLARESNRAAALSALARQSSLP